MPGNSGAACDTDDVAALVRTEYRAAERTEYVHLRVVRSLSNNQSLKRPPGLRLSTSASRSISGSKLTIE